MNSPRFEEINCFLKGNKVIARTLTRLIYKYASQIRLERVKIMNFCGTHEWTTVHYGIRSLMPPKIELVAGPGCPVCITPSSVIENAINIALEGVRVYTFGDAYRLPVTSKKLEAKSLEDAKSKGGDVKVIYSFLEAIRDAKRYKESSVFVGIGFETTAPGYSIPILNGMVPENLFFYSVLRLTPPAARYAINKAIEKGVTPVHGIIAPGHVSAIIGSKPWDEISRELKIPSVISGFESLDVLYSIALILKMLKNGEYKARNEYSRVVEWNGNRRALKSIEKVFGTYNAFWRGIGVIPMSGLELRSYYNHLNAKKIFKFSDYDSRETSLPPGCRCAEVTLGLIKPIECPLFMKTCKPEHPYGPCMVSLEGACSIWARHGGRIIAKI